MMWRQRLFLIALSFLPLLLEAAERMPRVILVAQNSGTEITDLLVPFAILSDAGMEVEILATEDGPVNLMNGVELLGLRTLNEHSGEAIDLVVIPAVHHPNQKELLEWLKRTHEGGAMLASICDGVEVLAGTGLLNGRRATGHFYSSTRRESRYPEVEWIKNTRYVRDGQMLTTAGVSASIPAAVYLVEALLGIESANKIALQYGVDRLAAQHHDSSEFSIGAKEVFVGVRNFVRGLFKTKYNIKITPQVDEHMLALTIDALGRTYRASVALDMVSPDVTTKRGLKFRGKPAYENPHWRIELNSVLGTESLPNALVIDTANDLLPKVFQHIRSEFGQGSAEFVATQLELPLTVWSK